MRIILKETFLLNGKEFRSLDEIEKHFEHVIGQEIDHCDNTLTPRQKLNIFHMICAYHEDFYKISKAIKDFKNEQDDRF